MGKSIEITCTGASALEIQDFTPLQGKLKTLDVADYKRLKNLILDLGFCDPIAVWRHNGKNFMLNGHQRVAVIQKMIDEEDYFCPPLPVSIIAASNLQVAKKKLLAMSTQFGRMEGDGLYNFIQDLGFEPDHLLEEYRFADFSMRDFVDSYLLDPTPVRDGGFDGPSILAPSHPDTPSFPEQMLSDDVSPPPVDKVSNTQVYKNETKALESFLGSDVRRITIYMNPNDYDTAVSKMSTISEKFQFKDYRDVLFYLLNNYGQA